MKSINSTIKHKWHNVTQSVLLLRLRSLLLYRTPTIRTFQMQVDFVDTRIYVSYVTHNGKGAVVIVFGFGSCGI